MVVNRNRSSFQNRNNNNSINNKNISINNDDFVYNQGEDNGNFNYADSKYINNDEITNNIAHRNNSVKSQRKGGSTGVYAINNDSDDRAYNTDNYGNLANINRRSRSRENTNKSKNLNNATNIQTYNYSLNDNNTTRYVGDDDYEGRGGRNKEYTTETMPDLRSQALYADRDLRTTKTLPGPGNHQFIISTTFSNVFIIISLSLV